ncbi:hypothetical protein B0H19DRAFT_1256483 [Mycena capillaripes]|nr:hypothetical protein B0H19DRAFT_1256483 [Mycena capillaripes]
MASGSTSAMSLFPKRRRAFIACASCRKHKVKCVKTSSADYAPCTRCSLKGHKCEFYAVSDHYPSSQPSTPPAATEIELAPHDSYSDPGWTPPPMTCPSAGIGDYLGKTSFSAHAMPARRNSDPPIPRYPYQRRHAPTNPRRRASQPRGKPTVPQQALSMACPQESLQMPMPNHLCAVEPQWNADVALYLALSNADGSFYGECYGKEQSLLAKQCHWPQVM